MYWRCGWCLSVCVCVCIVCWVYICVCFFCCGCGGYGCNIFCSARFTMCNVVAETSEGSTQTKRKLVELKTKLILKERQKNVCYFIIMYTQTEHTLRQPNMYIIYSRLYVLYAIRYTYKHTYIYKNLNVVFFLLRYLSRSLSLSRCESPSLCHLHSAAAASAVATIVCFCLTLKVCC